jgi:NADPH:quinone reductase-like Zn-dependent oxidoreductase
VVLEGYGQGERLELREVRRPEPGAGQLLVRVMAVGVDAPPARAPLWRLRPAGAPWIPGLGIAGEVAAVGPEIADVEPGDSVYALLDHRLGGGYAEYAVVRRSSAALEPAGLSHEEAAVMPVAALTALQALRDLGGLQAGQQAAIHGAAGGVGHFAVQIAAAMGARVTAVTEPEHEEFVRRLGAERVVDDSREDFTILEPVGGTGARGEAGGAYHLIFDTEGVLRFADCEPALVPSGTFVTTRRDAATLVTRLRAGLAGLVDRRSAPRAATAAPTASAGDLASLAHLVEAGRLRPVVDRVYALGEAGRAHAERHAHGARGVAVLRIDP